MTKDQIKEIKTEIEEINQHNVNHNSLEVIKTNYMQYGKLKQIAKEMERLKKEAEEIIKESFLQHAYHNDNQQLF